MTALIGMVMLLTDWPLHFPTSDLRGTPSSDYTVPALLLGIVVGGSALLAMGATIKSVSVGAVISLAAGVIMMGWIVGEWILLPTNFFTNFVKNWAQAEYFLIGLAMVVLALRVAPSGWRGMLHTAHLA